VYISVINYNSDEVLRATCPTGSIDSPLSSSITYVDRYQTPPAPVLPLVGQFEYKLWRHILLRLLLLFSNFEYTGTPFALRICRLCVNMTSSVKLEVHNISQRRQTGHRATLTTISETWACSFGDMLVDRQAYTQIDTLITILRGTARRSPSAKIKFNECKRYQAIAAYISTTTFLMGSLPNSGVAEKIGRLLVDKTEAYVAKGTVHTHYGHGNYT